MQWKIFGLIVLSAFTTVLVGQACSDLGAPGANESSFNGPDEPLMVTPANVTLQGGATVQLTASGGEPPYSFTIINSGLGTVSPTGLYTAPATISGSSQTVIIAVNDQDPTNTPSYAAIQLVANQLSATYSPTNPRPGTAVTIYPSGGTPPYYYQIIAGSGTLVNHVYQAPNTAETARINVIDALNLQTNVTIQIR